MPNFAAIDLGTNGARMKIVEARDRMDIRTLGRIRFPLRLGHDVFRTGEISEESTRHAVQAFVSFRELQDKFGVHACRAIATSAVRESENRDRFLERIAASSGIKLEIISSTEEARLLMMSIREKVALGDERILHVEIGGGSIELSVFDSKSCELSTSLKLGALRLHEMFLAQNGGPANVRTEMEFIERMLADTLRDIRAQEPVKLVATGGNPESLARQSGEKKVFTKATELRFFPRDRLEGMVRKLSEMSFDERVSFGLEQDRADVIVPAGHLLSYLVEKLGFDGFYYIEVDLRDGLIRELVVDHFTRGQKEAEGTDVALGAALRLGRRFGFDEAHSVHVMKLSGRLFEALQPVHKLGHEDGRLLQAAALLHDIGHVVGPSKHHKHSYYLIRNSELMGLTDDELEITASIARYHRKSTPGRGHDEFAELEREDRSRVKKLAAILRIADSLDREHKQQVRDIEVEQAPGMVLLTVRSSADCLLERWALEERSGMFKEVFKLEVETRLAPSQSSGPAQNVLPRAAAPPVETAGQAGGSAPHRR